MSASCSPTREHAASTVLLRTNPPPPRPNTTEGPNRRTAPLRPNAPRPALPTSGVVAAGCQVEPLIDLLGGPCPEVQHAACLVRRRQRAAAALAATALAPRLSHLAPSLGVFVFVCVCRPPFHLTSITSRHNHPRKPRTLPPIGPIGPIGGANWSARLSQSSTLWCSQPTTNRHLAHGSGRDCARGSLGAATGVYRCCTAQVPLASRTTAAAAPGTVARPLLPPHVS